MNNKQTYNYAKTFLGKGGAIFRSYCGLPSGAAWCDAFVTYVFHHTSNAKLFCSGKKQTYCPTTIKILQKDMAQIPLYLAMPMDVIFFDWDRNGCPNHIGFVRAHKDTSSIYTIEGNTDGGKVAQKTRAGKYVQAVFRPHFTATYKVAKLAVDGDFGYNSIAMLQKMLGITVDGILGKATVKALQKWAGCSADGQWGKGTSKAVQKKIGVTADGEFGKKSVTALQKYINSKVFPSSNSGKPVTKPTTKPTTTKPTTSANVQKLIKKMNELAWAYGTAKKKYAYKTGNPKQACKKAMAKHGYKSRINQSDCGMFVNTVVREAGIDKGFESLKKTKGGKFVAPGKHFDIVFQGKAIPAGVLQPGDIIRYKKTNGQHAMFYYGNGRVCDAGRGNRFANIRKDEKRYAGSKVKKNTIQVLRVK